MSVDITGLVDEELLAALPKTLKYIAHNGMRPLGSAWGRYSEQERNGKFGG